MRRHACTKKQKCSAKIYNRDNNNNSEAIMKTTIMKNRTPKALAVMLLSIVGSSTLLGCSQHADDGAETLASKQILPQKTEVQASRNTGAWGGVYMSRDELKSPPANIVDTSSLPTTMADDASLSEWEVKFEGANAFITTDGKKLYHDSCAGCHMHKGEGAQGAGYYPPLADNSKMQ
jgi:cytochrome c553